MQVSINDTLHDVPFDLSVITLGKYLTYYDKYGRALDNRMADLLKRDFKKELRLKYGTDPEPADIELMRDMDVEDIVNEEALSWFSFWTGEDLLEAKGLPEVEPLLETYRLFRHLTNTAVEDSGDAFPMAIEWNGEQWRIQDYKVHPQSAMSFNEIITSKEVMRQLHALSMGHWDAMPYLCAIFFRKGDEPFTDELIAEGGERVTLMKELPLIHAIQVAFFLSICVTTWSSTSLFFPEREGETASLN